MRFSGLQLSFSCCYIFVLYTRSQWTSITAVLLGDPWHDRGPSPLYKYTSHGHCACPAGGLTLPLRTRCLFSAPLSSSSACGSIDKHSWLCNRAVECSLGEPNTHIVNRRLWQHRAERRFGTFCDAHISFLSQRVHSTPQRNMNGVWVERLSINRVLWRAVWTRGNRQGIVLPGLSVSGL